METFAPFFSACFSAVVAFFNTPFVGVPLIAFIAPIISFVLVLAFLRGFLR